MIYVKGRIALVYLFVLLVYVPALSGQKVPPSELEQLFVMPVSDRPQFIHNLQLPTLDSADFISLYHPISAFAEKEEDWHLKWLLQFHYFHQRGNLHTSSKESIRLLHEMEQTAIENDFEVGEIVVRHFLRFEEYYAKQLSHGALYTYILEELGQLREIGFEKFVDYYLVWMLYYSGQFMYQLGDFEKALQFFKVADQYIDLSETNGHIYILVQNHLQTIYQKSDDLPKGISYAKKILAFTQSVETDDPEWQRFYRQWQGLACSDISSMLVKQGKIEESVPFAQRGYALSKTDDTVSIANLNLEYTALQVLVSTKLEAGDLTEVRQLLDRLTELYDTVGGHYENYFKNSEYFLCMARYHEMQGEYAETLRFTNLAKPLQDSLARRNDARHLEQLKQRLEAEKFTEKIRLVEQERELQKWLRNAVIIILILILLLVFLYFQRLRRQRQQQAKVLEIAKLEMSALTQSFRKKSEMVDNLRLEMEKLVRINERSEYLEKLINSTILTENDWLRFRKLFEKAHPGFMEAMITQHTGLTPAELRYLTLEKLNLNTNEMANMLGISANAVRKTKSRLKQKIKV